jgi:hypothetical protein
MATRTHSSLTYCWNGRCTSMTPESHRIRIVDNVIWYDIWKGVSTQRLRDDDVLEYLLDDLSSVGLGTNDIKNYSWIVNTGWEGHSVADIEHFRVLLLRHGLSKTRFGAVFIAYEDVDKLPYPAICLTDRMIYLGNWYNGLKKQNVDWLNMPMTSAFTVLMRRASVSRCHLANRLLQQFDSRHMIMTLGTNPGTDPQQFRDIIKPHTYPIVVDLVESPYPTNLIHNHEIFYQAPVQLVIESSNEIDADSWNSIFITEKSYKVFSWHQFPVWYAVPGLVEKLREQGFDLFDDIIDHSYDQEQNSWVRMIKVVEEITKLVGKDTKALRRQHWKRLESNAALVEQIHTNARKTHKVQTTRLIDEIHQLHESTTST